MAKKEVHRRWLLYFCRFWLVSLAFAYPQFVIMMHNVALTQDVSCARYGNGVRSDRWRLCELHRLWAKVLWFCGFVLRSGTDLLTGRRTKPFQQPVQQNV